MRRVWVLIAALLACAIITATPAVAQEGPGSATARQTQTTQSVVATPTTAAVGGHVHQGWFRDYNTCIWGIGVPVGVAWVIATTPQTWAAVNKLKSLPGVGWYVPRVMAACGRFLRS